MARLNKKSRPPRGYNPELSKALLQRFAGQKKTLWGVPLKHLKVGDRETWMIDLPGFTVEFKKARQAVIAYLEGRSRTFGNNRYVLKRTSTHWWFGEAELSIGRQQTIFLERPTRKDLADAIRLFRQRDSRPSNTKPNTLGWRTWVWDRRNRCLKSPAQGTKWEGPELIATNWTQNGAVRGYAGIHACRLPRGDWKLADRPHDMPNGLVLGLVERFGKYVLGEEGWRAEWVIIKEFLAPNEAVARTLRKLYPEVVVHVAHPNHWLAKGVV